MTALRPLASLALAVLLTLAGCGTDPTASDFSDPAKVALGYLKARQDRAAGVKTLATLVPADFPALRAALEKDGQPILLVRNKTLKFAELMAPYGTNGGVQTWSTEQYTTLSTRDGILLATRGFGPDLMSSVAPSLAQIAAGQGSVKRRNYYLDGADQPQSYAYDCTLAPDGAEAVSILGKTYATRRIAESCSGSAGNFKNLYWFDNRRILRQSQQFLAPGLTELMMQRVID